jgi:hypothetical protein
MEEGYPLGSPPKKIHNQASALAGTGLMVAIQNASALVAPACCTKPSRALNIPEHSSESAPKGVSTDAENLRLEVEALQRRNSNVYADIKRWAESATGSRRRHTA